MIIFFRNLFKFFKRKQKFNFKNDFQISIFSYLRYLGKKLELFFFFVRQKAKFFLFLIVAFFISDLVLIQSYNLLIPDKNLPSLKLRFNNRAQNYTLDLYRDLWEKNIFHRGSIPLKIHEAKKINQEPILSSLPFILKGTIIHANPLRSVATISTGSVKNTLSYQQGDNIENQADIRDIQRGKVIFFNQNNNSLEYIKMNEKTAELNLSYTKKSKKSSSSLVERKGLNHFRVKRSDVQSYLKKLPEILTQARVVPYRSQEGKVIGWQFASIDEGSVFEDLGFEKGDVLKEVEGETVQSPEQALELFDKLKTESKVTIVIEKDGKDRNYEYNVKEDSFIQ